MRFIKIKICKLIPQGHVPEMCEPFYESYGSVSWGEGSEDIGGVTANCYKKGVVGTKINKLRRAQVTQAPTSHPINS